MLQRVFAVLGVAAVLAGCAGVQSDDGPSTEEIAADLASQVIPALPEDASVLILGFYESGSGNLHAANDALTADLTIEFLSARERAIRVINRDILNQALNELKFSLSELSDADKARQLGGFLSADVLVKGTVSSDFVSVECTDVETLTLIAVGKHTAAERMVFAAAPRGGPVAAAAEGSGGPPEAAADNPWTGGADLSGRAVTVLGPAGFGSVPQLGVSLERFERRTGIRVEYLGTGDVSTEAEELLDGGDPPDIALFSQPGLSAKHLERGDAYDLREWFPAEYIEEVYEEKWLDVVSVDGALSALPIYVTVKSLVWYDPEEFERFGYEPPETWPELYALLARMREDGNTPWSVGIESDWASGWAATDWLEDLMLRTAGADAYDAWVRGELRFRSAEVRAAAEELWRLWGGGRYVLQDREGIVTTPFAEAAHPLFREPPEAMLHHQAWFMRHFLPDGVTPGGGAAVFVFPALDGPAPMLVVGDLACAFEDRPEVRALMRFFSDPQSIRPVTEAGEAFAPHREAPLSWYPAAARPVAEGVKRAQVVRFDASDMMPEAVNRQFWQAMVDWIGGARSLEEALASIDETW